MRRIVSIILLGAVCAAAPGGALAVGSRIPGANVGPGYLLPVQQADEIRLMLTRGLHEAESGDVATAMELLLSLLANSALNADEERRAVTAIQWMLTELRFEPGPVDGVWGRLTARAVARYAWSRCGPRGATVFFCDWLIGISQLSDANLSVALVNRGIALEDLGEYERAIDDYNEVIRLGLDNAAAYNNRGGAYQALGESLQALEDFRRAIQINPDYALAFYNRGNVYQLLGEMGLAIEDYNEAIRLDPSDPAAFRNRGVAYRAIGDFDRAIEDFDAATRLAPYDARPFIARGSVYHLLDDYQRALEEFDAAIRLDPGNSDAYGGRADAYRLQGQHLLAIEDFDEAIRLNPDYAWAYGGRGASHMAFDQYDRAIEDFDEAVRLDPHDTWVLYNRGLAYAALSEPMRAIEDYDRVIGLEPKGYGPYFDRGLEYLGLDEAVRAIRDFDMAMQLYDGPAEDRADLLNIIAWSLYLEGYSASALPYADRALGILPAVDYIYDTRAHIYASLGRAQEALAEFERAMEVGGADQVRVYQGALATHGYDASGPSGTYGPSMRVALKQCLQAGCRLVE